MRLVTIIVLLLLSHPALAQDLYVRQGASGTHSGSDWVNACPGFSGACDPANLPRGRTVWVADGVYGGATWDAPESGTQVITIMKATASNHGTDTGWHGSFGDGAAEFDGWVISTSHWVFDGQVGQSAGSLHGVPALPNYLPHGFRVTRRTTSTGAKVIRIGGFGDIKTNITLRHVEAGFLNTPFDSGAWGGSQDIVYAAAAGLTCSYCWLHDAGRVNWFPLASQDDIIFENGVLERNGHAAAAGANTEHSELYAAEAGDNHVFRYSVIRDWRSTGGLILHNEQGASPTLTNWQAYGNIFTITGYFQNSAGDANGVVNGVGASLNMSAYVYNNTFVDIPYGCSVLATGRYATMDVKNNIFYNCNREGAGGAAIIGGSHDYNWFFGSGSQSEEHVQIGSGDPFVNRAAGDYRLISSTSNGFPLGAPFDRDRDGNTRGSDGSWDRGAFEYVGGGSGPAPAAPTGVHILP